MDITKISNEDLIILNLKSKNKLDAIKEMADLLNKNDKLWDKNTYIEAVLKREEEYSTGIGMGVAIPHGKSSAVKEAALVIAKSENGIDFSSMDGELANLIFLIAVPEHANDLHLKILSELSRQLMHEEMRNSLISAKKPSEIIEVLKKGGK